VLGSPRRSKAFERWRRATRRRLKKGPREAAFVNLTCGDIHRDFKAKTHICEIRRDPLHVTAFSVTKLVNEFVVKNRNAKQYRH
jgi:hypothetical protein